MLQQHIFLFLPLSRLRPHPLTGLPGVIQSTAAQIGESLRFIPTDQFAGVMVVYTYE